MATTPAEIVVSGMINSPDFQIARKIAQTLAESHTNVEVLIEGMVEADWERYIPEKSKAFGRRHVLSPLVYYNGINYVGGLAEFADWSRKVYGYDANPSVPIYQRLAKKEYMKFIQSNANPFVYLDFLVGDSTKARRVVFELFQDRCPKATENFIALCCGDRGDNANGVRLSYEGTPVHRVVPGGWIQAGDIVKGSGDLSVSVFDDDKDGHFADECLNISHERAGILSMSRESGRAHSNGSQFFVTLGPLTWLDTKRVAFGRVISGMRCLREIEKLPLVNERPAAPCRIGGCGVFLGDKQRPPSYSDPVKEGKAEEPEGKDDGVGEQPVATDGDSG